MLISFDVSGTFDGMKLQIKMLGKINVNENLLNLIKSFLVDRKVEFYAQ